MAYESGALSQRGRARLERHLRECTICQRELAAIQTYEATVDAIREDRGPELDWSKMERVLEREAQAQAKKHRRGWMVPAMGVALAAAAALALVVRGGSVPAGATGPELARAHVPHVVDGAPAHATEEPEVAPETYATARVTLVAGASDIRSGERVAQAATGAALAADDEIETTDHGSLHARLTPGRGIVVEPSTRLRLARLDSGASALPELVLARGTLGVRVREARTVILAGQFRIEADVASFVIDFDAERATLRADVREGEIRITGPELDTRITGPARFPADAEAIEGAEPVGMSAAAYETLPSVHVTHGDIVRWQLGDVAATGAGEMAMRVGEGPLAISGWDERGRLYRATVTVGPDGLDLTPDELRPEAPRIRAGVLSREEIVPVVHAHQAAVQRCYEHQLRSTPTLEAVHVVARISVEMTGSVDTVRFDGDDVPDAMAQCMRNQIGTWIFPAPHGGPVTIDVPFGFEPR